MTQQELEAGATAVADIAAKHGYGSFISRDMERMIAAAVIRAYEAARSAAATAAAKPTP
jgi:hypothetical protein